MYWLPAYAFIDFKECICLNDSQLNTLQWSMQQNVGYYPHYSSFTLLWVGMGFDRQVPAVWVSALLPAYLWEIMWHCKLYLKSLCVCVRVCAMENVWNKNNEILSMCAFVCVHVHATGSFGCLEGFDIHRVCQSTLSMHLSNVHHC